MPDDKQSRGKEGSGKSEKKDGAGKGAWGKPGSEGERSSSKGGDGKGKRSDAAAAYLKQHALASTLEGMVNEVMASRPENPYAALGELLAARGANYKAKAAASVPGSAAFPEMGKEAAKSAAKATGGGGGGDDLDDLLGGM